MNKQPELEVVSDSREFASRGAQLFIDRASIALQKQPYFTFVGSGGNTPRPIYDAIVSNSLQLKLPWEKIHVFLGDERNVMPDHAESNFHSLWIDLLSRVPIPKLNIHRYHTEFHNPREVAQEYEGNVRTFFALEEPSSRPSFDLVFLGLGIEGHTASLFPDGIAAVPVPGLAVSGAETDRLVIAPWVTHLKDFRYSLTPAAFSASRDIVFLVTGPDKAAILQNIFQTGGEFRYPAQWIQPSTGRIQWLVDSKAASLLKFDLQLGPKTGVPPQGGAT